MGGKRAEGATPRCTSPPSRQEEPIDGPATAFDAAPTSRACSIGTRLLRLLAMILLAPLVGAALVTAAVVTSIAAVLFPNRR